MKRRSTNDALDRLARNARIRKVALIVGIVALTASFMVLVSNKSKAQFRFMEVVGARFQADDSGPSWRIEVKWNGDIRYFSTDVQPGPLQQGDYICVHVRAAPNFAVGRLGVLPAGICNKNGVFAPEQ